MRARSDDRVTRGMDGYGARGGRGEKSSTIGRNNETERNEWEKEEESVSRSIERMNERTNERIMKSDGWKWRGGRERERERLHSKLLSFGKLRCKG